MQKMRDRRGGGERQGRKGEPDRLQGSRSGKSKGRAGRKDDGPAAAPGASKGKSNMRSRPPRQMTSRMLAAIVESCDAAIMGNTLKGIVTSWNAGAERIFGYSASEMIGKPIFRIAAPGRVGEMRTILDRIGRGERVEHHETERQRKDGSLVPISLTVSPIFDERGKVVGVSKVAQDITDRKRAEAQLKAKSDQLEELALLFDLAPAMVRRLDGRILRWGRGLRALYGWEGEAAVGCISHELLRTEFPAPLAEIEAELLGAGEWEGELVNATRDGRRVTVASLWALHGDSQAGPASVLEVHLDLTEVRRTQSMLEEREARLRSILDTAPDAIITIDGRGLIQSFSAAAERLFGYTAGEVVGRNVSMLMPTPYREEHDGYIARYLSTGEKRIIGRGRQVKAQRRDGTVFPIHLAVGEVVLEGVRLFSGFIHDLTAQVRMEQELRQSQKMEAIGQLTGGIAHDFNNLLTVVAGNLEMLERRLKGAEDREVLNEAQDAVRLGAELTRRLLAFGRRQALHVRPTDLNALVSGMSGLLRRTLGEAIEIESVLADGLPAVMVDSGQMENSLLNLAINARDAMPNGGRLFIRTSVTEIDRDDEAADSGIARGSYVTLT